MTTDRYAIRSSDGKFLAAYRADSERRALGMFETDMAREAWTFRRSAARINMRGITATIEAPPKFYDRLGILGAHSLNTRTLSAMQESLKVGGPHG